MHLRQFGPPRPAPAPPPAAVPGATLGVSALLLAALAAGFALAINIVHYRTWAFIPAAGFQRFHDASAAHTIPLALLLGLPSLVVAVLLARRGLPAVPRARLWLAAALAGLPWVATPLVFLPLQGRLHELGPTMELIWLLVDGDLVLRAIPPTLQAGIYAWALRRALTVMAGAATSGARTRRVLMTEERHAK